MANSICISSGHGEKVTGAIGIIHERNEAVRVVDKVAEYLRSVGITVYTYHENTATTSNQNLANIVNFHNSHNRELDVSIHFNACSRTDSPRGTECYYYDSSSLASSVSKAISDASGLINRGGKEDKELYVLRNTNKPAILIEVCFVDSSADVNIYNTKFDNICRAIAGVLSGKSINSQPSQPTPQPQPTPTPQHLYRVRITWADAKSQIGAFGNLDNAKALADQNKDHKVFDENGNVVYDPNPTPVSTPVEHIYRVRTDWLDVKGQIGAFKNLDSAKALADANTGYKVFDENGAIVYAPVVKVEPTQPTQPTTPTQPVDTHTGHNNIMGNDVVGYEKMVALVQSVNPNAENIKEIALQFLQIGRKYGIRGDIAFCQSILETHYFLYDMGTAVTPDQNNFCGMGVTQKGEKGNSFASIAEGVTAQIQHLYAYATSGELPTGEVTIDPRFKYVSRGIAPHWEDLNGHWAMNDQYGQEIIDIYNKLVTFPQPIEQQTSPTEQDTILNEKTVGIIKKIIDYLIEKLKVLFNK